ncbi:MAG: DUF4350 domain-containing protein [Bacteroidota bacterium]
MRNRLPYIILIVAFIGYVLLELLGPQPENWTPSYEKSTDSPFGSYVLFESLPDLFPESDITVANESPAQILEEFEAENSNYIIVQEALETTQFEAEALIKYMRRGNNLFIAAAELTGALADTFGLTPIQTLWTDDEVGEVARKDYLKFAREYDERQVEYPLIDNVIYQRLPGGAGGEFLSHNKKNGAVFMRQAVGEGYLYVHSIPLFFTNYFMVDPVNHEYISRALSFLPDQPVIWDEFFKPNKIRNQSPVKYLLETTSLRWAWLVMLGSLLVFLIFEGKRRQRIVPVIEPPANTTLEFAQTVGRLYYAHGDHKDIAEKKIRYLLEYIRNRWMLPTSDYSKEFIGRVAAKSGVAVEQIQELFTTAEDVHRTEKVSEGLLHNLSRQIDEFYALNK